MLRRRNILITLGLVAVVFLSLFLAVKIFFIPSRQASNSPFFVGVEIGAGNVTECKALIDRVKNYTNLLVIASPMVLSDETMLNKISDYTYNSSLYFMIYFSDLNYSGFYPGTSNQYNPSIWLTEAKEKYGDRFLGTYYSDEPGGHQLDEPVIYVFNAPQSYMDAANAFVQSVSSSVKAAVNLNHGVGTSVFTSDYGLYWFDYKAGYDVVLAQFGWNNSRPLQIALTRGAAKVQNKDWGVMITWTYNQPPYLESGVELYDDMVLAYNSGAKYVAVYDASQGWQSSTLTEEHFDALKNFWNYVQQNPDKHGSLKGDVALVLPQDYGFGFRNPDDSIWGFKQADDWTRKMYSDVNILLNEYKSSLDIVYNDPEFNNSIKSSYGKVIYWTSGAEADNSFPVINLNNTMGYATIQEAINSYATYNGDIIFVKAGTYLENVVVNRSISLVGEDKGTTIIDGGNIETALNMLKNDVNVTGFTVRNGGNVTSQTGAGIRLSNANNCNIKGNIITTNNYGIYLEASSNNTLRDNTMVDNKYNFGVSGNTLSDYINDIDSSNTVDGKPVYYWINRANEAVPSDAGYVALVNCTGINVRNLRLSNNYDGLLLAYTQNSMISNNILTSNHDGIRIAGSSGNVLRNNDMRDNMYNFYVQDGFANDADASNKVDGKPVYYWVNQHDKVVPSDAGYVALINCSGITVQNLQLANNGQGILLSNTRNSTITQNIIANQVNGIKLDISSNNNITRNSITANQDGISLEGASNNTIVENNVTANTNSGITVMSSDGNVISGNKLSSNKEGIVINASSNNSIHGNNITANAYGIRFQSNTFCNSSDNTITENNITANQYGVDVEYGAENNTFYHNNFVNNTNQVYGMGIGGLRYPMGGIGHRLPQNSWDNGSEGNYWSDYTGTDTNHDGIGDTPYVINYMNQDNYPLVQPFAIPSFS